MMKISVLLWLQCFPGNVTHSHNMGVRCEFDKRKLFEERMCIPSCSTVSGHSAISQKKAIYLYIFMNT